jgi:hypothetical protein
MEPLTRFVTSSDGTRIAYDVQGHGPALILLPGRGFPRRTWHEYGYPSRLQDQFTVITWIIATKVRAKHQLTWEAIPSTITSLISMLLQMPVACLISWSGGIPLGRPLRPT